MKAIDFSVGSRQTGIALLICATLLGTASRADAQASVTDVLSFLLTNRSIPTDDFAGDAEAAAATRDTISTFLLTELGTLPVTSSATGFAYRLNPELGGVPVRSTESFGPFFTERSLTIGARHASFGIAFQQASFDRIDGRSLRDGTLVATASRLTGVAAPFDVEALTLELRTNTVAFSANIGLTDQLEVGVVLPFVDLTLSGERVDTYRDREFIQATGSASASGPGDLVWRAKYNLFRSGASGVAISGEGRLPTGSTEKLLGGGQSTFKPRFIASVEQDRLTLNGEIGYALGGVSKELDYSAGLTAAAGSRLTIVGELVGRRLSAAGHLTEIVAPHPRLVGVETIRLTSVEQGTNRIVVVGGVKWNIASAFLVAANLSRFLTQAGLTARWIPALSVEYTFGR